MCIHNTDTHIRAFPTSLLPDSLRSFMGGPPCCLSILRKSNVPFCYFRNFPGNFEVVPVHLSILRNSNVPYRHFRYVSVDFRIVQCRLMNLRKGCVALSNLRIKGPTPALPDPSLHWSRAYIGHLYACLESIGGNKLQ